MLFTPIPMMGDSYDPDALALFARMSVAPSAIRKSQINKLIKTLKNVGIWSKFDAFYVFAAHDSQAALLNWVSTSYNAAAVNSPTFTTDRGFTGNGSSAYVRTYFNAATASSPKFVQNSAHLSVWNRSNSLQVGADVSTIDAETYLRAHVDFGSPQTIVKINSSSPMLLASTPSDERGLLVLRRATSSAFSYFVRGSLVETGSYSSTAPQNSEIVFLRFGASYSNHQSAAGSIGASLSDTEVSDYHNALQTYMTAVGA